MFFVCASISKSCLFSVFVLFYSTQSFYPITFNSVNSLQMSAKCISCGCALDLAGTPCTGNTAVHQCLFLSLRVCVYLH